MAETSISKKKTPAERARERKITAYQELIAQKQEELRLLTEEETSLVNTDILGLPVFHKRFGPGLVCGQDSLTVTVAFDAGSKRFSVPYAFLEGFLQAEDAAQQQRLSRCQEIHAQRQSIQNDISLANHAIRLLEK